MVPLLQYGGALNAAHGLGALMSKLDIKGAYRMVVVLLQSCFFAGYGLEPAVLCQHLPAIWAVLSSKDIYGGS